MEGNVQHAMKKVSKFDRKNADGVLEWPSKLRVSLSLYNKSIFEIVQGTERPPDFDNDQATACEGWDDANNTCSSSSSLHDIRPSFLCRAEV